MRCLPEESSDLLLPCGEVPGVSEGGERSGRGDEGVESVEIPRGASGIVAVEKQIIEQGLGDDRTHAGWATALASLRQIAVGRGVSAIAVLAATKSSGTQCPPACFPHCSAFEPKTRVEARHRASNSVVLGISFSNEKALRCLFLI